MTIAAPSTRRISPRLRRAAWWGAIGVIAAQSLTGCAGFQIHERICSAGSEPLWYFAEPTGSVCLADGERAPDGAARFPRGKVPIWVNPPASYAHRDAEGRDAYYVNPNDPAYPWFDEVLLEHPELACNADDPIVKTLPMRPEPGAGKPSVAVLVRENAVGNRCLSFGPVKSGAPLEPITRASLTVVGQATPTWTSDSAVEPLRVATRTCLRINAEVTLEDGTRATLTDLKYGVCDPAFGEES